MSPSEDISSEVGSLSGTEDCGSIYFLYLYNLYSLLFLILFLQVFFNEVCEAIDKR